MGSTHKTIYMPDLESLTVPLPSVAVQDRIVRQVWAELARIDRSRRALSQQVSLLQERRQALITAAVTGQMAIPGVPSP